MAGEIAGKTVVAQVGIKVDALEYLAKSRVFHRMPETIRTTVLSRAFRAVSKSTESRVVKSVAAGTNMRQKDVRATIHTSHGAGGVDLVCRSKWIRLTDLGAAKQTRVGVWVRGWGTHKSAFLIKSRNNWAYARVGKARLPIKALWGPNPAQFINKHRGDYEALLASETERVLLPEVERLLGVALATL